MTRLFQFRAGRCQRRGQTTIVDPSPAKGLLYVEHHQDDGNLNHLCYKDLESGAVMDDFILFAGDASFKKVLVPNSTSARVYVLCFSSSNQKVLYWMQDPDPTTDASHVTRLNQLIEDGEDDEMPVEWSNDLGQEQELSPEVGSTTVATSAPVESAMGRLQPTVEEMSQLQKIIDGFSAANPLHQSPGYKLSDILTIDAIEELLEDVESVESLKGYLPPGLNSSPEGDKSSLIKVIRSGDFRAAVESLDRALRGPDDDGLRMFMVHGLGLDSSVRQGSGGVQGYVEAIMKANGPNGS